MYDRFTIRARQVMQSANKEAERFEHEYIAPEHILSGLLKVGDCLATTILNNLGVDLQKAVGDSETTLQSLQKKSPTELPRAKMVIESAMMEPHSKSQLRRNGPTPAWHSARRAATQETRVW